MANKKIGLSATATEDIAEFVFFFTVYDKDDCDRCEYQEKCEKFYNKSNYTLCDALERIITD